MAAERALADRNIVSTILHALSDMTYKVKRQFGPDQPVEFLEFRPTLVPSILVNRTWAEEGILVLWENYPHLPALAAMELDRRQYYASKVRKIFTMSPPVGSPSSLEHLRDLRWPNLKSLEMDVDFARHGEQIRTMMHPQLEHLELSGYQSEGAEYFRSFVLPSLFGPCENLKSIRFGSGIVNDEDVLNSSFIQTHLEWTPSITAIEIKTSRFTDKDSLFCYLSQRPGLEELELDLDPGCLLVPVIEDVATALFQSLKSLTLMCYPEVALALMKHLGSIERLQLELCRIPDQPMQDSDLMLLDNVLTELSHSPKLQQLKIGVGAMAVSFPSAELHPILSGHSLVNLSKTCPKLTDLNLFAMEPSGIDASRISSEDFDLFGSRFPKLKSLCLKLHPPTTTSLSRTMLQSLGRHCPLLEMLRLKSPLDITLLSPTSSTIEESPHTPTKDVPESDILIDPLLAQTTEHTTSLDRSYDDHTGSDSVLEHGMDQMTLSQPTTPTISIQGPDSPEPRPSDLWNHTHTYNGKPLFPHLTHLAISRPDTSLASALESFSSSEPIDPLIEESLNPPHAPVLDPIIEEELVHTWSAPLYYHFPQLEILEAWGDWTGEDNESLNYFLPNEEILASTWEFLSGVEQDLWDEEDEGEEDANWVSYEANPHGDYFGNVDVYDDGAYFDDSINLHAVQQQSSYIDKELEARFAPVAEAMKGEEKVDSFIEGVERVPEGDLTPRVQPR